MAYNGSGTYAAPGSSFNPAVAATEIDETDWATLLADFETALTLAICKDGQSTTTAAITFAAGVQINNTGLKVFDTNASHYLSIVPGSDLTAARTLTLTTGDAARTITLTGDLAMSGAFNLTLTTTGATNVTFPTTGTLATTTGTLSSPTITTPTITSPIIKGSGTVTLADGATPALDAALGNTFLLTAAGNRTIAVPSNATGGQRIVIVHLASGAARTLALNTGAGGFRFGTDITALSETASGKTDYIGCIYSAADTFWDVVGYVKGY